jgi:hypothetical protein
MRRIYKKIHNDAQPGLIAATWKMALGNPMTSHLEFLGTQSFICKCQNDDEII